MKVLVIGSSHGGFEAIEEMQALYNDVEIKWFEQGDYISFMSWGMHLYLEGVVKDVDTIRYASKEGMEARGVEVFPETQVINIDPSGHKITVKDLTNDEIRDESYDKLILAVGVKPFELKLDGYDLKNVQGMGGRDSAVDLRNKALDPSIKNVVVIGGGYIGIEAAEAFARTGKNVTVIDILDRPLDVYLDKELTTLIEDELKANGVVFKGGEKVSAYCGENGFVKSVKTDKGEYPAELVITATGVRPNTEWLKDILALNERNYIVVDGYMQTNQPDILAVGCSTIHKYNPTGKMASIGLATNARKQGRWAAKNLLGAKCEFKGVQGSSGLAVFDYKFASTGINEKAAGKFGIDAKSVYIEQKYLDDYIPDDVNEMVYAKLLYRPSDRKIIGAQIMSKKDLTAHIHAVSVAIMAGFTIDDLAYTDFFFQPRFNRPWNILNQLGVNAVRQEDL